MDFQFYMPTRVVCGKDCLKKHAGLLSGLGRNAFIMTGPSSAQKNGALPDLVEALESEGMEWFLFNKVTPNPSLEEVRAAAEEARIWGADCIIAIGGGSPMDAAKAVAVLTVCNISDEELITIQDFEAVLPLVMVPTTVGTGSEVTPYSILTNNKLKTKSFLRSDQIFPKLAFLDAKYCIILPAKIAVATTVDAMSHCIEGYLAVRAIATGKTLALEALRLISRVLPDLIANTGLKPEQWENLLYASMLAGIVIAQSGTTAVHALGYSLTYFKGIDHGVANGYLIPEYLKFLEPNRYEDIQALLTALGEKDITGFQKTLKSLIGTSTLNCDEIDQFAGIAAKAGNIKNTFPEPSAEDLRSILTNSFVK